MRTLRLSLALLCLSMLTLTTPTAWAGERDNPDPLPGWTHSPLFGIDLPKGHGIRLSGKEIGLGSPVIAEIDGNAQNGKEAAFGGKDGLLYVYGSDGRQRWAKQVLPAPCSAADLINSGPAVGAILGDGVPYVVVSYGSIGGAECDGGVIAFDGRNGNLYKRFSLRDWAQAQGYREGSYGVISTPALADTDGDGRMEIGFGGFDRNIYLLNADFTPRWYYNAADSIWSSPTFFDINGDRRLEMIIGADISANGALRTPDGGYVYAFNTQQRPATALRVPFQSGALADPLIWRATFDQAIFSSPTIGDVLPNNPGSEIVVGAGCFFPTSPGKKRGDWVKILRLSDGAVLQTLNSTADCVRSAPALGDIDDDGKLEVVVTAGDDADTASDVGQIIAWDPEANANPKWKTTPFNPISAPNDKGGNARNGGIPSPVIADLDGNGSLEVAAANFWSVHVLRGSDGVPLTCQNSQCGKQISLFTWGSLLSTPAVGDLNNDGKLDLVIGGMHSQDPGRGYLYAWTNLAGVLGSPQGSQKPYSAPWPMLRGDQERTGVFAEPRIFASTQAVSMLVDATRPRSVTLLFTGPRGASINWSVTQQGAEALVKLNREAGTSADALVITANAVPGQASVAPGTYTATLTVRSGDLPPLNIVVTVTVVARIYDVLLPMAQR